MHQWTARQFAAHMAAASSLLAMPPCGLSVVASLRTFRWLAKTNMVAEALRPRHRITT